MYLHRHALTMVMPMMTIRAKRCSNQSQTRVSKAIIGADVAAVAEAATSVTVINVAASSSDLIDVAASFF